MNNKKTHFILGLIVTFTVFNISLAQAQSSRSSKPASQAEKPITWSDVAPIFESRCIKCHSFNSYINGGHPPEGLSLQSYEDIMRGGERVVVIPGRADVSELVKRIRGQSRPIMPFDGPPWLSRQEVRLISNWVRQGAKGDDGQTAPPPYGQKIELEGRLTGFWTVDGFPVNVSYSTRIKKKPRVGDFVEVDGIIGQDGKIWATRIKRD